MAKAPCKNCKKSEEECEECPEWIFTFADLVMLMMGFFVILWVLKPNPGKEGGAKQELPVETVAAIRGAFGYSPDPSSKDPVDMHMMLEKEGAIRIPQGGDNAGRTLLPSKGADGSDPEVTAIREGKTTTVGGRLLFEVGSTQLTPAAVNALDQIADKIRGHRNIVLVKGHTAADDLPEKASAQAKMDLSLKRAQAVADYLVKQRVEPEILRVQGCSTFEPVTRQQVYHLETRGLNRRVEVEATATLVEELSQTPASASSPTPERAAQP